MQHIATSQLVYIEIQLMVSTWCKHLLKDFSKKKKSLKEKVDGRESYYVL